MNNYIIVTSKKWFLENNKKSFTNKFFLINRKKDLNIKLLSKLKPKYIFFPHWSHIVPAKILNEFNCICFHTSNLPFGRGGSPIQNLIKRKIYSTYVCAIKMTNVLDGGPIYCKKKIKLTGSLDKIFMELSKKIMQMMLFILKNNPKPKIQKGKELYFKRLKPKDSKINTKEKLIDIYDKIRMLDHKEYPNAFLKSGKYAFFFRKALKKKNKMKIANN